MFDWDDANVEHIAEHDVTPEEAEEAFADRHKLGAPVRSTREPRRGFVGATQDGRVLFIVYTRRNARIRVISARNASQAMRRRYHRQK